MGCAVDDSAKEMLFYPASRDSGMRPPGLGADPTQSTIAHTLPTIWKDVCLWEETRVTPPKHDENMQTSRTQGGGGIRTPEVRRERANHYAPSRRHKDEWTNKFFKTCNLKKAGQAPPTSNDGSGYINNINAGRANINV